MGRLPQHCIHRPDMPLKQRIQEDIKTAMRGKEKARVAALRLVSAAIKQREVDARSELDDAGIMVVLDKMAKQRRDSIRHYEQAARADLSAQENFELELILSYLPEPLTPAELDAAVDSAIAATGAASGKDMGRVMGKLKSELQGRADLGQLSARVKSRLAG